ncbi:hypothetical protein MUS1_10810 [Marinomonas ushuaiensis DSM 15871]|uniref:Uncharacterized protein n=1 Tax=Marinomonas ushuaiensis DSM 15871 TaxID=1122207 RepID=X7E802_9GAMM|nr:hypothetical protein [Marinomonas ushuaiensis]ETX11288.1 hypothetical protein MUS1_10810 [Marinomonas ushuaiensis DSM 15871]
MQTEKWVSEMIDSVNTSYMSEAEKHTMLVNTERADFIANLVVSGFTKAAKVFTAIKKNLNPYSIKHA